MRCARRRGAWTPPRRGSASRNTAVSLLLPWCPPAAAAFGFVPLPALLTAGLVALVAAYVATTELAKRRFYRTAPDR